MINMRTMPRFQTQSKALFQVLAWLLVIAGASAAVFVISSWNPELRIPAEVMEITVAHGDTLWKIAQSIAPDVDPRRVVWEIQTLNQIETAEIFPGQVLKVPIYDSSN